MMPKLSPTQRLENECCEALAEGVAASHCPAETDHDKGMVAAAEIIAAKIRARRLD